MRRLTFITIVTLQLLVGCSSPGVTNQGYEQTKFGNHWFAQITKNELETFSYVGQQTPYLGHRLKKDINLYNAASAPRVSPAPPLSPGDRIRVLLTNSRLNPGEIIQSDRDSSSIFEINIDGNLSLPYLPPINVAGLTISQVQSKVKATLEEHELFKPGMASVHVAIAEWAPVTIFVSGAVFNPGQVTINQRRPEERQIIQRNQNGDYPIGRLIQSALMAAGGVTPDADVANVELIRGDKLYSIDLLGAVLGLPVDSIALTHGDIIRVNSSGQAHLALIKPSSITPPGLRINVSNLTRPAFGNAISAIGKDSTNLPYGTRLLTATINGNCVGGAVSTNSNRIVVLVSTDPISRKRIAIERQIEDLLRAPHRLDLNPFVMPNDSIVCYDSKISNLRDIGLAIRDVLFPASILFKGTSIW